MRSKGKNFELLAKSFLESRGIAIKDQNFYTRMGEIDMVGWDGDTLVFFEVRYRKSFSHGGPLASISRSKQNKIIKAASYYLLKNHLGQCPVRFDAVGISGEKDGDSAQIEWIKSAFIT